MKKNNAATSLLEQFSHGKTPKEMEGLYAGKLEQVIPVHIFESLGEIVSHFWLPWLGKNFDKKQQTGSNLVPSYLTKIFQTTYASALVSQDKRGLFVFPFTTRIAKGLQDDRDVLQLHYALPQNPPQVRQIIDEIVEIEKNRFLGKAFLKKGDSLRLVAFFSLKK